MMSTINDIGSVFAYHYEDDADTIPSTSLADDEMSATWIIRAASAGETRVVRELVEGGIDPAVRDNAPIYYAARNGHDSTVDYLLTHDHVDPTEAFIAAVANNHPNIVFSLLYDPLRRVDPSVHDNWAICHAARHGLTDVVNALIQDPDGRVDCLVRDSKPLRDAAAGGHYDTVYLLLDIEPAGTTARMPDPADRDSEALREAASRGHAGIVTLLLDDGRADPTARDDEAICVSAERGHLGVVRALLDDGRANPAARDCDPLLMAAINGWLDVVVHLDNDGRSHPTRRDLDTVIVAAVNRGYYDIARVLLGP